MVTDCDERVRLYCKHRTNEEKSNDYIVNWYCIRLKRWLKYSADPGWIHPDYPDAGIEVSIVQQFFLCKTKRKPKLLV